MIVVLSDLHFSEAESTEICGYRFNRNLSPDIYQAYFSEINQFAKANNMTRVDLVLAGDILEITRSAIWLEGQFRPYINNDEVIPGSAVEEMILKIMDAIAKTDKVKETLAVFRTIKDYFEVDIQLHLILGNHDRLINATPKTRSEFRKMFGLPVESSDIPNYLVFEENDGKPFCLVRHGHEYDPTNLSWDLHNRKTIPLEIPKEIYGKASMGDIISIEFGAALPWLFVKEHGKEKIVADPKLMAIYQRLMEFDDVRPTTAWLAYLFSTPGVTKKETWHFVKPAFTKIINTLGDHQEFNRTLKQSAVTGKFLQGLLMGTLKLGVFKKGIPYWLIRQIMRVVARTVKLDQQVNWARREAIIQDINSGCQCVVSGHTHVAEVSLISADNGQQRYYLNTGTWRNVIPATKNFEAFGHLKALTKVMIFSPKEEITDENNREWAFRHMSGVSYGHHRVL